jgi:integrase
MAVQKKNGKWYAVVYIGMRNGTQHQEYSKGYDKKSDAQLAELEMKKAVIESEHRVCDKESLHYIAERWLGTRKKTIAPSTYRQNEYYYNHYIKAAFDGKLVKNIDTIDITDFMLSLEIAPGTVNKVMNILKQILDFAVAMHYIRSNPGTGVKKPAIKRRKKVTWTPKQIKEFLALPEVKTSTCYVALWILFSTGMRPGEVCGLRWCDWYGDYFVPEIGIDTKRGATDLKNEKAHEPIYIDTRLEIYLKKTRKVHETLYISLYNKSLPEDSFINCFTDDYRPMTVNYLHHVFDRIIAKHDFPETSFYAATRHSFGTNMMKDGVNPKMVADMMRHTTVRTTLDNYSHTDTDMYKNTVKMYNNKIV